MAELTMLTICGQKVPQPSEMQYVRVDYDSEDTFRSMSGDMVRDRITTKVKLECKWPYLELEDASILLKAVEPVWIKVGFYDPYEGKWTEKTMYVGDRTMPYYNAINGKVCFTGISMNFIEK